MPDTTLSKLAGALRTYLVSQLSPGGNEVLAFEPFGIPIDTNAFRSGAAFNSARVSLHVNELTDRIGLLNRGQFQGHQRKATDLLRVVLFEATSVDPTQMGLVGEIKTSTNSGFRQFANMVVTDPDTWYDLSVSTNWTTGQGVSTDDTSTTSAADGGAQAQNLGWIDSGSSAQTFAPAAASDGPSTDGIAGVPDEWELRVASPSDHATLSLLNDPNAMAAMASAAPPASASNASAGSSASAATAASAMAQPATTNGSGNGDMTGVVAGDGMGPASTIAALDSVNQRTTSRTVATSSLQLSFDLCAVNIDRRYWSSQLLQVPVWYMPSFKGVGDYLPGPGRSDLYGLASTMLLVKNLVISGFSKRDTTVLSAATGLGPFSFIGGRTVEAARLSAPGVQVVGWVCELLPAIPPVAVPGAAMPPPAAPPPPAPPPPPSPSRSVDPAPSAPPASAIPSPSPTVDSPPAAPVPVDASAPPP